MSLSRRSFVQTAAGFALGCAAFPVIASRPRVGLKVLILGGTSFLGPACTESLLARGHTVTHFNRGRLEGKRKELGRPSVVPDGVEILYGNRDPEKTADDWKGPQDGERDPASPKGLSQLEGKKWDAVIDTSGFVPRIVKASAELLAPNVSHYIFISTVSVYGDNATRNQDESAPLGVLADERVEEMGATAENYGPLKALCEQAAEGAMPGRVANVRPGFIVGPRDTSNRFIYWPRRIAEGGEMLVPGTPADPVQLIDVRDLADWLVRMIEARTVGVFNATGPVSELSMKHMVEGCREGVQSDTSFTWVDAQHLAAQGVGLPIWIPASGDTAGFHTRNVSKAVKAGLTFRPVSDTAKATLEWYRSLPDDVQARVGAHILPRAKETELLEAWKALPNK
jgi:2'-hydroxyisoflavone reductase